MERGAVLVAAGEAADFVYFPNRGLISLVKPMRDGRTAEVGIVGIEGLSNVSALLGVPRSPFDAIVQVEGQATRIKTADVRREMRETPALAELVTRYMYYKLNQLAQTAACNRLHSLRERCCRWLLVAQDNARDDEFTLTHEFLAMMMGVNRPHLTQTLKVLETQSVVRYRRARVAILDRAALKAECCECYLTLRGELELVYGGIH